MSAATFFFMVLCFLVPLAFLLWCAYTSGYDRGWNDKAEATRRILELPTEPTE